MGLRGETRVRETRDTTVTRLGTLKSTVGPKSTVGMPPKATPHPTTCSTFLYFRLKSHRRPLPHLKCGSEGTRLPTPTPGHSRYVIISSLTFLCLIHPVDCRHRRHNHLQVRRNPQCDASQSARVWTYQHRAIPATSAAATTTVAPAASSTAPPFSIASPPWHPLPRSKRETEGFSPFLQLVVAISPSPASNAVGGFFLAQHNRYVIICLFVFYFADGFYFPLPMTLSPRPQHPRSCSSQQPSPSTLMPTPMPSKLTPIHALDTHAHTLDAHAQGFQYMRIRGFNVER